MLPELKDFKPYQEAQEQETKARAALEAAEKKADKAAAAVQEADAGGADYKTLAGLKEAAAGAKRDQELAARELEAAAFNRKEQQKDAEEAIKSAARAEGQKIINKILKALDQLESSQKDYIKLNQELREKVTFPRPNVESETNFTGPDPGPIFKPASFKVGVWKDSALRFKDGKPANDEPKTERREVELPNEFVLS